jgi:hypothetical protein
MPELIPTPRGPVLRVHRIGYSLILPHLIGTDA